MAGTQKVSSTGRFGSRYGVGIRRKLLKVEPIQTQKHTCPSCGSASVKRKSRGIFECRKCEHTFVGGAYLPQTLAGGIISKMVTQKMFVPEFIGQLAKDDETPAVEAADVSGPEPKKPKKARHKEEPVPELEQEPSEQAGAEDEEES